MLRSAGEAEGAPGWQQLHPPPLRHPWARGEAPRTHLGCHARGATVTFSILFTWQIAGPRDPDGTAHPARAAGGGHHPGPRDEAGPPARPHAALRSAMSTPGLLALGSGQSPPGLLGDWPREAGCALPGPGDAGPALGSTDLQTASDVSGQMAARCPEEGPLFLVCARALLAECCVNHSV